MFLCCLLFGVRVSVTRLTFCLYILFLARFITFWERVAHSVEYVLFVFLPFVKLVISRFGFENWISGLIA